jgi:hypothetical protein
MLCSFLNDDAALNLLYLAIKNADQLRDRMDDRDRGTIPLHFGAALKDNNSTKSVA